MLKNENGSFYDRKLPHIQPIGATYFITFRLYGSVPIHVLKSLREQRAELEEQYKNDIDALRVARKRWFGCFDESLDTATNEPYWLRKDEIAEIVSSALHFYDGKSYTLHAFCIMPNHVHLLITLLPDAPPLYKILKSIKWFTARQSNLILNLTGNPFWAQESYDHIVRKNGEFERVVEYIVQNPVKARLVVEVRDWKWTFCNNV